MRRSVRSALYGLLAVFFTGIGGSALAADEVDVRLRIAWGGAERTTWSGTISLDQGRFADLVPLGIESDEPGCVWLEENVIHVQERSRRDYGGVDVSLVAPEGARLTVRLQSGVSGREAITETEILKLVSAEHRATLDSSGNYVLISRAPGDRLRVGIPNRQHVLYAPGETVALDLDVSPELLTEQGPLPLVAEVAHGRGGEVLHEQTSFVTRDELARGPLRMALPAPREEGVYEARLSLRRPPGIAQRFVPTAGTSTIIERRIQFVVFDRLAARWPPSLQWEQVASLDLANPNWSSRVPTWVPLERLPGLPHRPSSNVIHATAEVSGKAALVLPPPAGPADRPWYAIPVSVPTPNLPYLITLEVPGHEPSQLGLSILEPNAAGYVYPIARDFGLFTAGSSAPAGDAWLTKQFLFWPKTESPMLLLTNEHPHESAHVGVLRIYRGQIDGTSLMNSLPSEDHRTAAVLVDRPWLPESTGAREALDPVNRQSVDDWQTLYDATMRLVDYVQLAGYNAAVLTAFADGSAIYPSDILHSTPRYDTGVLATSAQDPVRKDFLELLLAAFDRTGLSLYVGLEFSTPLPELERLRRRTDPQQSGIEWIGADGQGIRTPTRSVAGGFGPHYNLLHPDVQEAVLQVVREVVARYQGHPSLGGLALQLSSAGYAQLVEPHWGFDDTTISRFEKDTGIDVPGSGPQRFAVRANFLLRAKRKEWIAWRAEVVSGFYARLRDEIRAEAEHRELWILPARLVERSEVRSQMRPSAVTPGLTQILLEMGIHVEALAKQDGIVLLRPTFVTPPAPVAAVAPELQVNASGELDKALQKAAVLGHLAYYPSLTRHRRLVSFDERDFFGEGKSFTAPLSQLRPLGPERGRTLARALAGSDPAIFVEGGQTLITELDEDFRRGLEIFRKLPSGDHKETVTLLQPITVRTYHTDVESFVCVVNTSPWPQRVGVMLEAPAGSQLLEIGTNRAPQTMPVDPARTEWRVDLAGFGVYAARISAPSARVVKLHVEPSATMQDELAKRINRLDTWRLQAQDGQPSLTTRNAGFEEGGAEREIAGWHVSHPSGGTVTIDTENPQEGSRCLRITSLGPAVSVASDAFVAPAMGRLSVYAHVRRSPESAGVSMLMIIEDAQGGTIYRSAGPIGTAGANRAPPIPTQWGASPFRYRAENIPLDAAVPLRVRFEVSGEGTVWIDNVVVWDESHGDQQRELAKIIYEAQVALRNEDYSDCLECLEGFWPRYVAAQPRVALELEPPRSAVPEVEPPAETDLQPQGVAERIKQMVPRVFRQ